MRAAALYARGDPIYCTMTLNQRAATVIHNLLSKPRWRKIADILGNRTAMIERYGAEPVQLSIGRFLAQGPEKSEHELDQHKLGFMREEWASAKSTWAMGAFKNGNSDQRFRAKILSQVQAGEARPHVLLGEYVAALRTGGAPLESYVFHNVSGSVGLGHVHGSGR